MSGWVSVHPNSVCSSADPAFVSVSAHRHNWWMTWELSSHGHRAVRCCVEGFGRKEVEQEKFHPVCPTIHHPWARHAHRNTTRVQESLQSCGTMTRRNSTVLPNLKTNLPFFLLKLQIRSHVRLAFRFHSSSLVWSSSYDETVRFLYFWTRQPQTASLWVIYSDLWRWGRQLTGGVKNETKQPIRKEARQ